MKCNKCSSEWDAAPNTYSLKVCPFCGASLNVSETTICNPTKVLKDILHGKYGNDVIHNKSKCRALFSDLIPNKKDQLLLDFLLDSDFAENLLKCSNNLNQQEKIDFCQKQIEIFIKNNISNNRFNESFNWFTDAIFNIHNDWTNNNPVFNQLSNSSNIKPINNFLLYCKQRFGLELISCTGSRFLMGSPNTEIGRSPEEIQHYVYVSDFYLNKVPVTQKLYKSIINENPSYFKFEDNPVECVDWYKAMEFCEVLNKLTESVRPSEFKFDLPTEAQWEYACRANTDTSFNNQSNLTNSCGVSNNLNNLAWYKENSCDCTHPVGLKDPNSFGLYDMHGNVFEWCKDWYSAYTPSKYLDPIGPLNGEYKVVRGGSWCSPARLCRSGCRSYFEPNRFIDEGYYYIGFRIALVKV